jgi:hypothetical protein
MMGSGVNREWISKIQVGDVLKNRSGTLRIVRAVHHSRVCDHIRTSVYFTIKHCSWTGRCYTILGGNDLVQNGYQPTGAKVKLRARFDRFIEEEFEMPNPILTCCDVRGIP